MDRLTASVDVAQDFSSYPLAWKPRRRAEGLFAILYKIDMTSTLPDRKGQLQLLVTDLVSAGAPYFDEMVLNLGFRLC